MPVTTTRAALEREAARRRRAAARRRRVLGRRRPGQRRRARRRCARRARSAARRSSCTPASTSSPTPPRPTCARRCRCCATLGLPLLAHAELDLGDAARRRRRPAPLRAATCSRARRRWEDAAIALLVELARETGCAVHIVHLSSAGALDRSARGARPTGCPITAETCPHYLCLEAEAIPDGATAVQVRAADSRAREPRGALAGAARGVHRFVVTDHSPCTPALKVRERGDFHAAWGGIASLQLGLPAVWTEARRRGCGLARARDLDERAPRGAGGARPPQGAHRARARRRSGGLGSRGRARRRRRAAVLPAQGLALPRAAAARARRGDLAARPAGLRRRAATRPGPSGRPLHRTRTPAHEQPTSAATLLRSGRSRRRRARRPRARRQRRVLRRRGEPAPARAAASSSRASSPSAASGWTAGRAGASAAPGSRLVRRWSWARRARCVGFDIDTQHFVGNHPPFASVDGLSAPRGTPRSTTLRRTPTGPSCSPQSPLRPDAQNLFRRAPRSAGDATCASTSFRTAAWPASRLRPRRAATGRRRAELDAETRAHVAPGLRRSGGGRRTAGSRWPAPTRSSAR